MLKCRTGDGEGITLELGEIGHSEHAGFVLLQEHHLTARAVESLPLLNPSLRERLRRYHSCSGEGSLQVQQQRLGLSCGAFSSMGTNTLSQTSASGSARVRQ